VRGSWRLEWRGLRPEYSVAPVTPPAADDDYYRSALWRRTGQSLL
jgi:hypothetical protein